MWAHLRVRHGVLSHNGRGAPTSEESGFGQWVTVYSNIQAGFYCVSEIPSITIVTLLPPTHIRSSRVIY